MKYKQRRIGNRDLDLDLENEVTKFQLVICVWQFTTQNENAWCSEIRSAVALLWMSGNIDVELFTLKFIKM